MSQQNLRIAFEISSILNNKKSQGKFDDTADYNPKNNWLRQNLIKKITQETLLLLKLSIYYDIPNYQVSMELIVNITLLTCNKLVLFCENMIQHYS